MPLDISAFRNIAYNTGIRDNVSVVLDGQKTGLDTVRSRGLFALFNKSKLTDNSAFSALSNALKADFKKTLNLSDDRCTSSVNKAFTAAFGKNFDLARTVGQKLTPSMLRTVLSAAQDELRLMTVKASVTYVNRMGRPLPKEGLAPAKTNFGKAQPTVDRVLSLLSRSAFSRGDAMSMEKTLTELKGTLQELGARDSGHKADFDGLANQIDDKLGELGRVKDEEQPLVDDLKANHPLSEANVNRFVGGWHQAAISVLRQIGIPDDKLSSFTSDMIAQEKPSYNNDGICTNIKNVLPSGTDKISDAVGKSVKAWAMEKLTDDELRTFNSATSDKGSLSKLIKAARTAQTESKNHWQNITKTISTKTATGSVTLTSVMTSGADLKGQIYGDAKTGGHTCCDRETKDAVNVWQSQLKTKDGRTLFNAVRHGVCVADKLKGQERTNAAISRAEGVAKAAFLARPDLQDLLDSGRGTSAENAIEFNVTTISLLSTANEGPLVSGQQAAFNAINGRNEPIELKLTGGKSVFIKPTFTMFSIGVNPARTFSFGQTKINEKAFGAFSERVNKYLDEHSSDPKCDVIRQLLFDVKQVVDNPQTYQRDKKDLYKASSRIAVLAHLIGEVPTFNCKSGKDRTGQNDVEAKFLATLIENKMPIPALNAKLTPEQTRIYRDITLQSGNLEIQQLNAGLGGFKTSNMAANITRMGGDDDAFMKSVFKGGGEAVSS